MTDTDAVFMSCHSCQKYRENELSYFEMCTLKSFVLSEMVSISQCRLNHALNIFLVEIHLVKFFMQGM